MKSDSERTGEAPLPPARGYADGCSKLEIWPLMMAVGFTCMAKSDGTAELILRAIAIAALTYEISHRLCSQRNKLTP